MLCKWYVMVLIWYDKCINATQRMGRLPQNLPRFRDTLQEQGIPTMSYYDNSPRYYQELGITMTTHPYTIRSWVFTIRSWVLSIRSLACLAPTREKFEDARFWARLPTLRENLRLMGCPRCRHQIVTPVSFRTPECCSELLQACSAHPLLFFDRLQSWVIVRPTDSAQAHAKEQQ